MGSEATPEEHIAALVAVFRECRRVLRNDGVMWVDYGDKAANSGKQFTNKGSLTPGEFLQLPWRLALALREDGWVLHPEIIWHKPAPMPESIQGVRWEQHRRRLCPGCGKMSQFVRRVCQECRFAVPKGHSWAFVDCPGCPKCAAADGYVLRRGHWRPTRAHEYIFMLTKTEDYFCDAEAVREETNQRSQSGYSEWAVGNGRQGRFPLQDGRSGCNARSVWTIGPSPLRVPSGYTAPVDVAHFASFPPELPTRCITASTSEKGCCPACGAQWARVISRLANPLGIFGGEHREPGRDGAMGKRNRDYDHETRMGASQTLGWRATCACPSAEPVPCRVLDPFAGAGTTLLAAVRLGRDAIGIELRPKYAALAKARLVEDAPMLAGDGGEP